MWNLLYLSWPCCSHTITLYVPKRNSPRFCFVTTFQTKMYLLALFRGLGTLTLLASLCIQKSASPNTFSYRSVQLLFTSIPSGHPINNFTIWLQISSQVLGSKRPTFAQRVQQILAHIVLRMQQHVRNLMFLLRLICPNDRTWQNSTTLEFQYAAPIPLVLVGFISWQTVRIWTKVLGFLLLNPETAGQTPDGTKSNKTFVHCPLPQENQPKEI